MSERGELVARLHTIGLPTARDAISQIERDGREIDRLRKALKEIDHGDGWGWCGQIARAALNEEK